MERNSDDDETQLVNLSNLSDAARSLLSPSVLKRATKVHREENSSKGSDSPLQQTDESSSEDEDPDLDESSSDGIMVVHSPSKMAKRKSSIETNKRSTPSRSRKKSTPVSTIDTTPIELIAML